MNYQKKITNPITLIAIFATLSETSAAISLPFLDEEDRDLYVWFLISFPFYLLLLFFVTLNFNYRSLYAPSDFQDESNFVKATNNPKPMATDGGTRLSAPTPSNTRKGTQSVPSTSNAQAPPCDATQHKTGPEPERLQLPAEAKDLRIIDIRETSTQVELNGSLKSIWIPQNNAAQVIVFITCAKSEVLLKARMLKYLKQKKESQRPLLRCLQFEFAQIGGHRSRLDDGFEQLRGYFTRKPIRKPRAEKPQGRKSRIHTSFADV